MSQTKAKTPAERVAEYESRKKADGFAFIRVCVPDADRARLLKYAARLRAEEESRRAKA